MAMNTERAQLIAYLATLGALVTCFMGAMIIGAFNDGVVGKIEVFGMGTLIGGLIGVLRMPTQKHMTIDNPPADPVPVESQS